MYLFFGDMKDNPRVKGMGLIFISFSFGRILFLLGEWRERLIKISREIIHCREGVDAKRLRVYPYDRPPRQTSPRTSRGCFDPPPSPCSVRPDQEGEDWGALCLGS